MIFHEKNRKFGTSCHPYLTNRKDNGMKSTKNNNIFNLKEQ